MNRATRTLIVMLVALSAAGIATYGVYRAIQNAPVRTVETPTTPVVVAAKAMPVGTLLTKDALRVVAWPASNPVPGGFGNVDAVAGRGLLVTVAENETITELKLAPREAGAGLPPTITPGMRAISIKVNEIIGVAGFVLPGAHVDVIVTVSGQGEGAVARCVVSDLLVMAVGTRYDIEQNKEGKPIPTTVVTVAVTPEDAERIALAYSAGGIVLALRNPLDKTPTQTPGIRLAALVGPPAPPPVVKTVQGRKVVVAAPPPPPPPRPYTVETIKAAQRKEEVVK
jgi:pilus assembly protein CpaB